MARKRKVFRTAKMARRQARKRRSKISERRKKEFLWRGILHRGTAGSRYATGATASPDNEDYDPDALSIATLMPSRVKRSLGRGLTESARSSWRRSGKSNGKTVKTHCRGMCVLPEMVGSTIGVHDGQNFVNLEIAPPMIGHSLGEFAKTRKSVTHTGPGVGATRIFPARGVKVRKENEQKTRKTTERIHPAPGGGNLVTARAVNLDCHHKHCYHIAKAIRGMNAEMARDYLEDVVAKKSAIPYQRRSSKGRGGNTMAGHRKGKMGPGKFPNKASKEFIKLINSAMDNARQRFDDIDAEDMVITHVAAHRGQGNEHEAKGQGRATPSNHYQVNLEIFLEYFSDEEDDMGKRSSEVKE